MTTGTMIGTAGMMTGSQFFMFMSGGYYNSFKVLECRVLRAYTGSLLGRGGEKFLGIVRYDSLKYLEELLNTDLGVKIRVLAGEDPRKARPFIGWVSGGFITIVFLTANRKRIKIDMSFCKKLDEECKWIKERCYVLEDWRRGGVFRYKLREELLEDYVLCGRCDDLDFLEELREVKYEG